MKIFLSAENPDNHIIIARVPVSTQFVLHFLDEEEIRDISSMACDLALTGLAQKANTAAGTEAPLVAEVEVAQLKLEGAFPEDCVFLYVHQPSGTTTEFTWEEFAEAISVGVVVQVTAGVAYESAQNGDEELPAPA